MIKRLFIKNFLLISRLFNWYDTIKIDNKSLGVAEYANKIGGGTIEFVPYDIEEKTRLRGILYEIIAINLLGYAIFGLTECFVNQLIITSLLGALSWFLLFMICDNVTGVWWVRNGGIITNTISIVGAFLFALMEASYKRLFSLETKIGLGVNKVNTYISDIENVHSNTRGLLNEIQEEIRHLKNDRGGYIESNMMDAYNATHDALLANKALAEKRLDSIELVLHKAKARAVVFNNRLSFAQKVLEREKKIKSIWKNNAEQFSSFSNILQLMGEDVKLIETARDISSKISIHTDIHQILTLANAAELTTTDMESDKFKLSKVG